jgi:glycosyltransferase involved in cell wall biosynthesis
MMHVAICSDGVFPEKIGGMQRHTRLLAETLARLHPELRITVIHTHPGKALFRGIPNIEEATVAPRPGRRQYLIECLELSTRFADVLRTLPDAIVYSQGLCVVRGIRSFEGRLVVNPHGLELFQTARVIDWAKGVPFRMVQRHTFRHATHVVSLGGRLTDILTRETKGCPGKVATLPNGVRVPAAASVGGRVRDQRAPVKLIFVGRLARNKGVADLLQAMTIIRELGREGHVELDIVGGGPMLQELRQLACGLRVTFHEDVSDSTLEDLYRTADVLVLPTLFEGMPTVVLEAMARALPVLVTDVGATRELVDESNGAIIPKRDAQGIARAILRMVDLGPDARRRMGEAGQAKVDARFTWERVAESHHALFKSMATRNPS